MSFIGAVDKGVTYTPGFFIADDDENVTRETKQFAANSALVVTSDDGAKHIPMGTAYPSNDGNAIGITYEDVDVTNGDMPGSVVTKADVYEDRLAITGVSIPSTVTSSDPEANPSALGWYEIKEGAIGANPGDYVPTADTSVVEGKTYYDGDASYIRLASAAKTALAALGFKFIASAPAVTRPY